MTKLTAALAIAICEDARIARVVAADLGVSKATVLAIREGRNWSLVTGRRHEKLPPPRIRTRASDRICSVAGCSTPQRTCGLCDLHYWRSRRSGNLPLTEKAKRQPGEPSKFAAASLNIETDDCIIWPHGKISGYGAFRSGGLQFRAHAWVCEQTYGPKPFANAHAAHQCGNRSCINKRHIRWATPKENIHDKALHGRQTKGEDINTAVLTREQVLRIANDNRPFTEIARAYGCGRSTVRSIHRGESWKDVTGIKPETAQVRQRRHHFSPEQVAVICRDPRSCSKVAKVYGCSASTINEIRRGIRAYA